MTPFYPARPVNGGPLPLALPKRGAWTYEPKINEWRALVHAPTGALFNRHGQPLTIAAAFAPALDALRQSAATTHPRLEWLDCGAFERRHSLGRGSLVVLDAPLVNGPLPDRQQLIYDALIQSGPVRSWPFLHEPPPENALLSFAYAFSDYGIPCPPAVRQFKTAADAPACCPPGGEAFPGEDEDGIWTNWLRLQTANHHLGVDLFEGMVAKRVDSLYPRQNARPDAEFPFWVKHRWAW